MTRRKSILVIEDMAPVRELLCKVLASGGFEVTGCPDGMSALLDAAQRHYDFVITDYRMPHMSGVEITRHLRSSSPETVIIGVSVNDRREDFLGAGANAFLLKPYQYDELLSLLK